MGFYVAEPEEYKAALPDLVGPIVRLGTCSSSRWNACVLVAYRDRQVEDSHPHPVICQWNLGCNGASWTSISESVTLGTHMDALSQAPTEWQFIRFTLPTVPLTEREQIFNYRIAVKKSVAVSAGIPIPALGQEWRAVSYSCYDQRRGCGHRLWKNISESSKEGKPVHVLLGGGDQLYNDNVWMLESLQQWLHSKKSDRLVAEPSAETKKAIADFYVGSYLRYLHFHPATELLRCTPQINTHDDHDHFDGWGSYPRKLQSCPLFRYIFEQSQRYYFIFQLATTVSWATADGFFVVPPSEGCPFSAISFTTQLGPSLAVVAPDSRSQRSRSRILSDATFNWVINAIKQYPKEVQHVLLLSAIPMLYPGLGILESLLKTFSKTPAKMLFKTGLYDAIYNHFDEPDLLDDVTDHWSSSSHAAEKTKLLEAFAATARERGIRVSITSGDVHLCALGYMQSKGRSGQVQAQDPGFITQIVTSAIGNKPPGDMVVSYIEKCTKLKNVGAAFQEGMADIFDREKTPAKSSRFNNQQNYCELRVVKPHGGLPVKPGNLTFKFVVLGGDPMMGDKIGDVISSSIPPLLPADAPAGLVQQYPGIAEVPPPKVKFIRKWCCCY